MYGSCCRLDEGNYEEPVVKTPGETLGIGDTLELEGLFFVLRKTKLYCNWFKNDLKIQNFENQQLK